MRRTPRAPHPAVPSVPHAHPLVTIEDLMTVSLPPPRPSHAWSVPSPASDHAGHRTVAPREAPFTSPRAAALAAARVSALDRAVARSRWVILGTALALVLTALLVFVGRTRRAAAMPPVSARPEAAAGTASDAPSAAARAAVRGVPVTTRRTAPAHATTPSLRKRSA
jgi:hypothetical protein